MFISVFKKILKSEKVSNQKFVENKPLKSLHPIKNIKILESDCV